MLELTTLTIENAVQRYNSGQATVAEIQAEWGRRYTDTRHVLLSHGAKIKGQTRLDTGTRMLIAERYLNEPVSTKDLAGEYKCSESTITNILKEQLTPDQYEAVKIQKKPWQLRGSMSETTKQIYAAIDDGWALDQLCAHFNQTPKQIKQFLWNRRYTHQRPSVSFCGQCGRQTNLNKRFCDDCSSTRKRNGYLRSEYGITLEDAHRMYQEQNGCCAVCHCVYDFDQLVVDHDHGTGVVRGLLCPTCNSGIGLLKEDVTIVESAVRYLKR